MFYGCLLVYSRIHFNNIHTSCLLPTIHPNKILCFMVVSSSILGFILIISTYLVSSSIPSHECYLSLLFIPPSFYYLTNIFSCVHTHSDTPHYLVLFLACLAQNYFRAQDTLSLCSVLRVTHQV